MPTENPNPNCQAGCEVDLTPVGESVGTRDCIPRTPWMVCWKPGKYPAGSLVYTNCGYFFTLKETL